MTRGLIYAEHTNCGDRGIQSNTCRLALYYNIDNVYIMSLDIQRGSGRTYAAQIGVCLCVSLI